MKHGFTIIHWKLIYSWHSWVLADERVLIKAKMILYYCYSILIFWADSILKEETVAYGNKKVLFHLDIASAHSSAVAKTKLARI